MSTDSLFTRVSQKLDKYKEKRLEVLSNRFDSTHIHLEGSSTYAAQSTFDLEATIFVDAVTSGKILLVRGDTASGKTSLCLSIEYAWWSRCETIPVYIDLALFGKTDLCYRGHIIQQTFVREGFLQDEILHLKTHHNFLFIFDGYKKMGTYAFNLYTECIRNHWNSNHSNSMLITCDSKFLMNNDNSTKVWFTKYNRDLPVYDSLIEYWITPLNQQQITQYLEHKQIKTDDIKYILNESGINSLVTNPFLLSVCAEIIGDSSRGSKEDKLYTYNIYSNLLRRWFDRSETQMRISGLILEIEKGIGEELWNFFINLAVKMSKKKTTIAEYIPSSFTDTVGSEWAEFIDMKKNYLCSGLPIKKVGTYKSAFLHDSLIDHAIMWLRMEGLIKSQLDELLGTSANSELDKPLAASTKLLEVSAISFNLKIADEENCVVFHY